MMPLYTAEKLARWSRGQWFGLPEGQREFLLRSFSNDTRQIGEGEGFVALKTAKRDGHAYLSTAQEAGASFALVERPVADVKLPQLSVDNSLEGLQSIAREHRAAFSGKVIGVTGSCGKTSTKELLADFLGERTLKTRGNLNNFLGVPLTLTRLDGAIHDFAVVEAGINQPKEMETLASMIQPDMTLITSVGAAHLEKLESLQGVAREKSVLGQLRRAGGQVLFPGDCWQYSEFQDFGESAWIVFPEGESPEGAEQAQRIAYKLQTGKRNGCRLNLESAAMDSMSFELRRPLSAGMLSNLVLSIVAAKLLDVSDYQIQDVLNTWLPADMRGELMKAGERLYYADCYNANPLSMVDAFDGFAQALSGGEDRCYVLGSMAELGEQSARMHYETGRQLRLRSSDYAFTLGENAEALAKGLLAAGNDPGQIVLANELAPIQAFLDAFSGAVFLKGSRVNALERLLPQREEGGAAC